MRNGLFLICAVVLVSCDRGAPSQVESDMNPTPSTCGNGIVEPPERCDDGNLVADDGCHDCDVTPFCGNGVVEIGEECDDGNRASADRCHECRFTFECGDGVVDEMSGEECDDGNRFSNDLCNNECKRNCVMPPVESIGDCSNGPFVCDEHMLCYRHAITALIEYDYLICMERAEDDIVCAPRREEALIEASDMIERERFDCLEFYRCP